MIAMVGPTVQLLIGEICDRFSGRGEYLGCLFPPHWEGQRESNQGLVAGTGGGKDPEFWGIRGPDLNLIEAFCNVNFGHVDGPHIWVGVLHMLKDALQGPTEFHALSRGDSDGVLIHPKIRVITNGARAPVPLGDNSQGADSKVGVVHHQAGWKEVPLTLVDHVHKLRSKERYMLVG
jgi:hypothetical protein